jgi:hypothetical protein
VSSYCETQGISESQLFLHERGLGSGKDKEVEKGGKEGEGDFLFIYLQAQSTESGFSY